MQVDEAKKLVHIQDFKLGEARPFSLSQVKPYYISEDSAHYFISELQQALHRFSSHCAMEDDYYLTDIIQKHDTRASSAAMMDAKRKEIRTLLEKSAFKVILREEFRSDGNVLPGRVVLSIKPSEDGAVK